MKQLIRLLFFSPLLSLAQIAQVNNSHQSLPDHHLSSVSINTNGGIQWTEGISWEQVKAKAKKENKYIFLDCFATWCGPCKKMDKEVYPVDSVGEYFNDKFISVKVQMDVTNNDNQFVQDWYNDAKQIKNQYRVNSYPGFLFFSPSGELVDKQIGYNPSGKLLSIARTATLPGKVYKDPFTRYNQLMNDYEMGVKQYDSMYYMLKMARKLSESDRETMVTRDLYRHLSGVPTKELYTTDRLDFLQSITMRSTDRWFSIFYQHSKEVNRIMNDNNYAQKVIDKIIMQQIIGPFLKEDVSGKMLANCDGIGADFTEADWAGLENKIRGNFSEYYVKRNVLSTQFVWYELHCNLPRFIDTYLKFLDLYGIDSHAWTNNGGINDFSYNIFLKRVDDVQMLNRAIKWMKLIVSKDPDFHEIDTYANLLYKVGKKKEALHWEKQALQKAQMNEWSGSYAQFFRTAIIKMEKGEKLDWNE